MNKNAGTILEEASQTFKAKNAEYGDNWEKVGKILNILYPNGIEIKSEDEHNRFQMLMMILGKLTRYINNWKSGHIDSIHDLIVYAALLQSIDNEIICKEDIPF